MSDVRLIRGLDKGCQLNGPQLLADSFVGLSIAVALPKSLDHILNADAAGLLAEQFFDQNVVGDRDSLVILAAHVASLSQEIVNDFLGRGAISNIIHYSEQLLHVLGTSTEKRTIVDLLKAQLFEDRLRLRSRIRRLLDPHSQDETVGRYSLRCRERHRLFVLDVLGQIFLSSVLDKITLLLHVV